MLLLANATDEAVRQSFPGADASKSPKSKSLSVRFSNSTRHIYGIGVRHNDRTPTKARFFALPSIREAYTFRCRLRPANIQESGTLSAAFKPSKTYSTMDATMPAPRANRACAPFAPTLLPSAAFGIFAIVDYSTMDATMPAPTVRPPSRIAKRSFSSIAIGTISSTATVTLSPGITISVPSGSDTMPVTSVVRK